MSKTTNINSGEGPGTKRKSGEGRGLHDVKSVKDD